MLDSRCNNVFKKYFFIQNLMYSYFLKVQVNQEQQLIKNKMYWFASLGK